MVIIICHFLSLYRERRVIPFYWCISLFVWFNKTTQQALQVAVIYLYTCDYRTFTSVYSSAYATLKQKRKKKSLMFVHSSLLHTTTLHGQGGKRLRGGCNNDLPLANAFELHFDLIKQNKQHNLESKHTPRGTNAFKRRYPHVHVFMSVWGELGKSRGNAIFIAANYNRNQL